MMLGVFHDNVPPLSFTKNITSENRLEKSPEMIDHQRCRKGKRGNLLSPDSADA